jgi:cellulose 1,4-beta-cellobiosidase
MRRNTCCRSSDSSISNSTSGAPGGYPSIYQGCHWGDCSSGGLTTTPVQASNLSAGKVTTSWSTTQPGGSNDYDVAYDIWFNRTSTTTTTGQPNCLSSTAGRAASRPRSR